MYARFSLLKLYDGYGDYETMYDITHITVVSQLSKMLESHGKSRWPRGCHSSELSNIASHTVLQVVDRLRIAAKDVGKS